MYTEFFENSGSCRSIMVTSDNLVVVRESLNGFDNEESIRTVEKNQYQLVTTIKVGKDKFAQCLNGATIDWYNIRLCKKILSLEKGVNVKIMNVAGEGYIKVVDTEEEYGYIYDSLGNLIAKEKKPILINVVFSGTGACLERTDLKTGRKKLYTLEGYLI